MLGQAGLECSANPRDVSKPQGWAPVPPTAGGIAINIGDMLSRWSDGARRRHPPPAHLPAVHSSSISLHGLPHRMGC
jgi:hypothetical protein